MTAEKDSRDSKYMVYHNKNQMNDQELITYLKSHLSVYTKQDEITNTQMIQYVSLTQGADAYRRASTLTMSHDERSSVATKKILVKSRANKARNSVNKILIVTDYLQRNNKNNTID